jgi:Dyp-type peroxidase family
MQLDLTQSLVDPLSPVFQPMLNELQANIIKGHGRKFAYHIFFQIQAGKTEAAKTWISDFAKSRVTSALKLEQGRQAWKSSGADGGPVFTLSVSASGYRALGFTEEQFPVETETPANSIVRDAPAFEGGAKGSVVKLGDTEVQQWDEPFRNDLHLLVIVADSSASKALQLSQEIIAEVSAFGKVHISQKGQLLHRKVAVTESHSDRIILEHFGYADGVSQPLYLKDEIEAQHSTNAWDDKEPLNLVLVADPNGKKEDSFGSFLVFRKLEQDVAAFMHAEENVLPPVKDIDGIVNKDLPGAMMVGRFRNGNVLVTSEGRTGQITKQSQITNDFDNSTDPNVVEDTATYSSKCPYFSHIRITNPRLDIKVNAPVFAHSVRLTRRSIPYDDIGRFGPGQEDLVDPTEEQLNECRPSKGVGLLFMSYQAHIGKQFEFIQNNWANHGHIAGHNVGPDGVIGQPSPVPSGLPFRPTTPNFLPKKMPEQWGVAVSQDAPDITFAGFVKMKGGEYFFTPSISFLQSLADNKT